MKLLVLIHGYGSSGKGEAIKRAVHNELLRYQDLGKLKKVLHGEELSKNSKRTKNMLRRFPEAKEYLQRANPGITVSSHDECVMKISF